MELTYNLTKKDHLLYSMYYHMHSVSYWIIVCLGLVLISIPSIIDIIDGADVGSKLIHIIGASIIYILLLFLLPLILGLVHVYSKKNHNLYLERKIKFREDGISSNTAIGNSLINWGSIVKLRRTANYLYLYLTKSDSIIIPLRVIGDKSRIDELHSYIESLADVTFQ